MSYKNFTITDFICNEYFQNWVLQSDEESNQFWETWVENNPDKKLIVEQAKRILLNIKFAEDIPSQDQVESGLAKSLAEITRLETGRQKVSIFNINRFRTFRKFAAVFIGIVLIGSALFYYNRLNASSTISTNYGELKHLILADGTKVTLNAHSTITFLKHPGRKKPREVKLHGEAFFEVTHLNKDARNVKSSERFIVSTEDLKVEVLGTKFNVKNRRGITEVALENGQVSVDFKHSASPEVIMHPGELVIYNWKTKLIKQLNTNIKTQTAWLDRKLILSDASVQTVIDHIEDIYGYKAILTDASIGDKRMEGTLLLDNLQDILFILSTSLNLNISEKDSTLIFQNNFSSGN